MSKPNSHKIIKTDALIEKRSRGTATPEELDLLDRRQEIEVDVVRSSDYRKNIRKYCVTSGCAHKLPGTWEHYKKYGNYCIYCRIRVNTTVQ